MQPFANRPRVVPIVPPAVLTRHKVNEPTDTRFRAAARLMQSLWRERQGLVCGRRSAETRFGSRLTDRDALAGKNFYSHDVASLVHRELAYREIGAVIDTKRLFGNLLSSQTLAFNLLGPLKLDLEFARAVVAQLFPNIASIQGVYFEHSPGRAEPAFTNDHTAFDAAIIYKTETGRTGFLAIEIKYSEAGTSAAIGSRARYDELAASSTLYRDPDSPKLRSGGLQQFWREHLLACSMIDNGLYDEGYFVVIAPAQNRECQRQLRAYENELAKATPPRVIFEAIDLETAVGALNAVGGLTLGRYLQDRYLNFRSVDRALFQVLSGGKRKHQQAAA